MKLKILLTTAILASTISFAALAADEHGHDATEAAAAGEQHADHSDHADAKAHDDGHEHKDEKAHFTIAKPESMDAAMTLLDDGLASAKIGIEGNDTNGLHESGEKLETAAHALTEYGAGNAKLAQALTQLSKTVDRFHHAAEDGNTVGAKESLQILEGQVQVVKMLAASNGQ